MNSVWCHEQIHAWIPYSYWRSFPANRATIILKEHVNHYCTAVRIICRVNNLWVNLYFQINWDPNLRRHPWTDFHHFSCKFKLTLFFMQCFQDFSKLVWVYEKYRKTLEIAWNFSSNAENALYFPKNLAILHVASVFFVNPDQFRKILKTLYEEKC